MLFPNIIQNFQPPKQRHALYYVDAITAHSQ